MLFFENLSWAALLIAPAHCSVKRQGPEEASSVISEIEVYVTEIPSILIAKGPALATELASIISKIDPTGVVGDIPSLISAYYPVVESFIDEFVSGAIPSGVVPTEIAAEIPTFVSEILPALITEVDAVVSEIPSTLPLSALPGLVTVFVQIIGSEVEAEASKLVPAFSSALFGQTSTTSASASASLGTTSLASAANSTLTKSPSVTPPAPSVTTSFASAGSTWKAEISLVVGFAVVVVLL
jgi:hypothetical protein